MEQVLTRLFELHDPLHLFLDNKNSPLAIHLQDVEWLAKLAFLADIFQHLNRLNASLHGSQTHIINLSDKVSGFTAKLELRQRRITAGVTEISRAQYLLALAED